MWAILFQLPEKTAPSLVNVRYTVEISYFHYYGFEDVSCVCACVCVCVCVYV